MAEEKKALPRGVVVEFDFTAIDGSQLLFDTAKKLLAPLGVDLTVKLEAIHLAGGNYQGGLTELFAALDVKQDSAKVAQDLAEAFKAALTERVAASVSAGFKAFAKALTEKGVKVVVATRADIEQLRPALADLDADLVVPYAEPSNTYGNCKWDAWRRACNQNGLVNMLTVAVAGSGKGVKSALLAGMSALSVAHDHVAYQDFGGADVVVDAFDAKLAQEVLRMLHM
ncbi:MAG: HAD hydrolase-like protein [Kiritimatiellae bacterium]|nr:HAD hydrolase-like protein [Kiritimatiellia bacterium]